MTTTVVRVGTMARQRDTETFDTYVRARLPHLLRFGRALTGSESAAADLVQDALEQTLLHWPRVTSDDPEGYVRRSMVNRNISVWRKLRRERLTHTLPEHGLPDVARDDELFAALRLLPPRQRAVIALRYYEDLSEAQTASLLGCSVGTVKSQASRAMARLRELLHEREDQS